MLEWNLYWSKGLIDRWLENELFGKPFTWRDLVEGLSL
jgi:hypothetical protein